MQYAADFRNTMMTAPRTASSFVKRRCAILLLMFATSKRCELCILKARSSTSHVYNNMLSCLLIDVSLGSKGLALCLACVGFA